MFNNNIMGSVWTKIKDTIDCFKYCSVFCSCFGHTVYMQNARRQTDSEIEMNCFDICYFRKTNIVHSNHPT